MRTHLKDVVADVKEQIRDQLRGRLFCLLIDIGSRFGKSFLGIGAQFMDQFEIKTVHLGMVAMHERNTAKYIEQWIIKILEEFNVSMAQVYTITTDNGAHVPRITEDILNAAAIAAAESDDDDEVDVLQIGDDGETAGIDEGIEGVLIDLLEKGSFQGSASLAPTRCAAHTVQLAVPDCLARWSTEMEDMKAACREMRGHITTARLNENLPPNRNGTRWSSEFGMVNALIDIRSPRFENFMSSQLWELAESMVKGLAPVHDLTTRLKAEQYVFGDLLGDLIICEDDLTKETRSPFAQVLLEKLRIRKETIMNIENLPFQAALYLDPRFNNYQCALLSADQKSRIIGYIEMVHKRLQDLKEKLPDSPMDAEETTAVDKESSRLALLYRMLPKVTDPIAISVANPMANIHAKLYELQYRNPPTGANFNVLQHWKGENDPELVQLANVILSVPASQVSVERSLSLILSKNRTMLHDENLEKFLFVKLNPNIVPRF